MNPENKKILWSKILQAGDFLKDKLPNHSNHPKGRNPYANVVLEIKNKFTESYKDIPDEKINLVLEFIDYLKKNPS